jgi:hypothetical protein
LRRANGWRRHRGIVGRFFAVLGNAACRRRKIYFVARKGDGRCVARRTQRAGDLAFGRPGRRLSWGRDRGRWARRLGPRDTRVAGDRANRPQCAGNKPRSRTSEDDREPDVKWYPSAEQRGTFCERTAWSRSSRNALPLDRFHDGISRFPFFCLPPPLGNRRRIGGLFSSATPVFPTGSLQWPRLRASSLRRVKDAFLLAERERRTAWRGLARACALRASSSVPS